MNDSFFIYGRRFFIFGILLLLTTIVGSYLIDPFSVYGRTYLREGVKVNSPAFSAQVKMGKTLAVSRRKPEVIILGSSRSSFGLSIQVPEEYFPGENIYNYSFPGVTCYELLRYFQHAVASAPIKQVYIGLDFYQFHAGRPPEKTFKEERLAVDIHNQPSANSTDDLLTTLLSVDAVFYSLKVLAGLYGFDNDTYLPNGFVIRKENDGGQLENFIGNEGKGYINKVYTTPTYTFDVPNTSLTSFDYFRQLVQLAHENQVKIDFFISPSHARQWEVIEQLGLWDEWEYWKREMLRITEQESKQYEQSAYPIHDFSGYSKYSTEAVPRTLGKPMRWYSDSSHYRPVLGNIILGEIIKGNGEQPFGRILSSTNINAHIKSIRADKLKYQANHTEDIDDIHKLIVKRNKISHAKKGAPK